MGTNAFAPTGFVLSRQRRNASPSYQGNKYKIQSGYGSKIGIGDLVISNAAGYVTIAPNAPTAGTVLGVFASVLPYYDLTLQAQAYGLNGSYQTSANPQADIDCLVFDDPDDIFRVQVQGGPWAQSWRGQNIALLAGTNGVPNASGISTAGLDGTTVATTATLAFRIQELVGMTGGPQDPANTNPWVEVSFNFGMSQLQAALGV